MTTPPYLTRRTLVKRIGVARVAGSLALTLSPLAALANVASSHASPVSPPRDVFGLMAAAIKHYQK